MSRSKNFSTSFVIVGALEVVLGIGLIVCAIIIGINAPKLLDYSPYGGPGRNGHSEPQPDIYDIAAPVASGAWTGVAAILLSCFAFASARLQSNGRLTCGMTFATAVCILNLACIGIEVWATDYMWDNKSDYSNNYGVEGQPFHEDLDNTMGLLFNTHIATAALAFLSLVAAIVHSTYCCRATCCGNNEQPQQKPQVIYQPYPVPAQPATNPDFGATDNSFQHQQSSTSSSSPPQYTAGPSAPASTLNLQQQYEQQYNSILQPPSYNESVNIQTESTEKRKREI